MPIGYFILSAGRGDGLRLKAYSASSRAGKNVIRIEVEATDAYSFAYALDELAAIQKGQRAPGTKPKKPARAKPLAPRLALPEPGEE